MSEKRILLASLLKPVNDTRMFEKLGYSLCKLPNTQVHIAGFAAPVPADLPANMHLHPVFSFRRLSMGRIEAQLRYLRLLKSIKPDLIIVCTHELLLPTWRYSRKYKTLLVYDVQENYSLNLTAQDTYNPILKRILAWGIRRIEKLTADGIAHFLLAERSYAQELPFIDARYTILENKYKPAPNYKPRPAPVGINPESIKLLYTGTISGIYGIFEAIRFAEEFFRINNHVTLTIIGYCAHEPTLQRLKKVISGKPYITLIGGNRLVPHPEILQAIATHDLGLLPYQPNPSTFHCIPTKLYEYMAYNLPVLIQQNPLWEEIVTENNAGLSINFNKINLTSLLQTLYNRTFYSSATLENVFWESEEAKLLPLISELLEGSQH